MLPENHTLPVTIDPASFRDPSGFVFTHNDIIYRAIAPAYLEHFDWLMRSGLFEKLVAKRRIVNHEEVSLRLPGEYSSWKVIRPEKIPFVSYPYEWSFSQLKDAALLTLKIQKEALDKGMILKDASSYNVLYKGSEPVFIDTLSFEKYKEGEPWKAYGQFCRHFLAPLALMSYRSVEISQLLSSSIDGISLALASSLLPSRAKMLNSGIAIHIAVHARIEKKYSGTDSVKTPVITLSKVKLNSMLEHLETCITGLKLKPQKTNWSVYAVENSYSKEAAEIKSRVISEWLQKIKPQTVWDMGSNTGKFSRMAAASANYVVAMDADAHCIEDLYCALKNSETKNILPLVINLSNPSPPIGWANAERKTIAGRGKADLLLALALVHHLRIGNNVPFGMIAKYFSALGKMLIIEFIPKDDAHVKQMIFGRENIFAGYSEESFRLEFEKYYRMEARFPLPGSGRVLFLMTSENL